MKILVTGGSGFIGTKLAERLVQEGHEVFITSSGNRPSPNHVKTLYRGLNGINWQEIRHGGFEAVFHQMANNDTRCLNDRVMMQANFFDTVKLFNELWRSGCNRFVYASSTAVYGNQPTPYKRSTPLDPLNTYARSKAELDLFMERWANRHGVQVASLRYCNVYGPGEEHKGTRMSMIGQIAQTILNDKSVRLFKDGTQMRDWVHVDDAVNANLGALTAMSHRDNGLRVYNVGSGFKITFNQLVRDIFQTLPTDMRVLRLIEYFDCPFVDMYQNDTSCCLEEIKQDGIFEPRSLTRGLEAYMTYLIAQQKTGH